MEAGKQYVGLHLAKRTMEVCVVKDGQPAIERESGVKTDGKGIERLLTKNDVVGMEVAAYMPTATPSCWRGIYRKRSVAQSTCSIRVNCG
ncbi:MAG: hypothetical protein LBG84_03580 [Treponema sp.]|jgi:hypothetical protein|nr:hypothetical protein [Treponema sp.]